MGLDFSYNLMIQRYFQTKKGIIEDDQWLRSMPFGSVLILLSGVVSKIVNSLRFFGDQHQKLNEEKFQEIRASFSIFWSIPSALFSE